MARAWMVWTGAVAALGAVGVASHWNDRPARAAPIAPVAAAVPPPKATDDFPPPIAPVDDVAASEPTRHEMTPYEFYAQAMVAHAKGNAYSYAMMVCGLESREWLNHVVQSGDASFAKQRYISEAYDQISPTARMLAKGQADRASREEADKYLGHPRDGCARLSKETGLASNLMQP